MFIRGQRSCPLRSLIGLDGTMYTWVVHIRDEFSFAFMNFKLHLFLIHKLSELKKCFFWVRYVCVCGTSNTKTDNGGWR